MEQEYPNVPTFETEISKTKIKLDPEPAPEIITDNMIKNSGGCSLKSILTGVDYGGKICKALNQERIGTSSYRVLKRSREIRQDTNKN